MHRSIWKWLDLFEGTSQKYRIREIRIYAPIFLPKLNDSLLIFTNQTAAFTKEEIEIERTNKKATFKVLAGD